MRMTKELLQELGSCGDYTRTFKRLFPIDQYPEGVEVNEEVCSKHDGEFPWSWAVDVMLTTEGQTRYNETYRELMAEYQAIVAKRDEDRRLWRERTGLHYSSDATGEQLLDYNRIGEQFNDRLAAAGINASYSVETNAQARAFGRVFDQNPNLRSSRVTRAEEEAVAKVERRVIEQHEAAQRDLTYVTEQLAHFTERLPVAEELVRTTGALVAPALARRAEAKAKLLGERAAAAQQLADEAAAEAKRLADEAAKTTTGDAETASEVAPQAEVETARTS